MVIIYLCMLQDFSYILLSLLTVFFGVVCFRALDALAYKAVLIFIVLIILSNTSALLYGRHVLNEDI